MWGKIEVSVQGLFPGYRGAAADVEQILLRWKILEKEVVQALQIKTSLCHVKTRIIFSTAKYNEVYIAPNWTYSS